jgi:hypothetical protein
MPAPDAFATRGENLDFISADPNFNELQKIAVYQSPTSVSYLHSNDSIERMIGAESLGLNRVAY